MQLDSTSQVPKVEHSQSRRGIYAPIPPELARGKNLYVIAEIGGNHEGDFDYACELVERAISSGADAIKFQIYEGDSLVNSSLNESRNRHFKKFQLTIGQYMKIAESIQANGVDFLASVWSPDLLERFDDFLRVHKVGSGDLTNFPLLSKLASKNKPLVLSTAMATVEDVRLTLNFLDGINPRLRAESCLCLMHCVAMYGRPLDRYANLESIRSLQGEFPDIHIGYSDHTVGSTACESAVALGARVLEVHLTDNKNREFRDHHFSMTAEELSKFRQKANQIIELLGSVGKSPIAEIETEERIKEFRRAVYPAWSLSSGTILEEKHLITLRPNVGIDARRYFEIVGKVLRIDKRALEPFSDSDFLD